MNDREKLKELIVNEVIKLEDRIGYHNCGQHLQAHQEAIANINQAIDNLAI